MDPREEVKRIGSELAIGDNWSPDLCFWCDGGADKDRKTLSIGRTDKTTIKYNCKRAKCNVKGVISFSGHGFHQGGERKFSPSFYTKDVQLPELEDLNYLYDTWGVDLELVYQYGWGIAPQEDGDLNLIMPVVSPTREIRGYHLRVEYNDDRKKQCRNYKVLEQPWNCWYRNGHRHIVVVEDQISALRTASYVTGVAIMGTGLSEEKLEEIARVAKPTTRVWIALDKDATTKAIKMLKHYRLYVPNLNVLMLSKDIKNMSHQEILALGGPFAPGS